MKKITFFFLLLTVSYGYSQVNLEDFETAPDYSGFSGITAAVVADPTDGTNTVGEMIVNAAGDPWQGANIIMQDNYIDLSTTKTFSVDVYSTVAFDMLGKADGGIDGAPASASDASYTTPNAWQTLTFDLTIPKDATAEANGQYAIIALFPNWNSSAGGGAGGWYDPENEITVYVDNITGFAGDAAILPPADPEAAPIPTSIDGETYSIYNDTNGYTTFFPFAYDFGTLGGEPDLDPGAGVNLAYKFNFGFAGYGVGEGGPDDVTAYDFVSFDYWASDPTPGFRFVLISNAGGVFEAGYEVGTDIATVNGAWTKVVIPMSYFTNLGFSDTALFQWKADAFQGTIDPDSIVYIDNILLTVQDPSLSVNEFDTAQFSVFPNPSKDNWNISSSVRVNTISVYDILGKKVISLTPNANETVIDASSLNTGMYFAKIESDNGSKTVKLIKE